ncbi:MAG TPA: glutamine amidotransferase [Myxococcales bacterium]|jgi:GMP synthase (glutamine-hydrolysing)|nr:glutamine amidotransferase [Myxococcales bacterium]HIL01965.1 glutamine amidotransferase [Myxococcales bacterium]
MKPILILKTGDTLPDVSARRGDFDLWIREGLALSDVPVETVCVFRDEPLPSPQSVAGVVVTGSAAMVSEREAWSERSAAWLAAAVGSGTWILGICYGHQLLAHALGGRVGPNPRGRQIGTISLQLDAPGDALLGGLPEEIVVQATHLEVVLEFPKAATALGTNTMDANAAFRVGERAWGVQFHPEFDADIMRGYIRGRRELIVQEGGDPVALEAACRDSPHGAAVLARFGELVRRAESS